MELKSLVRDRALVESGQWVEDIPNMGDLRLKVRGMSAEEAISYRASLERAVPRNERLRDGNLKPDAAYRVLCQVLLEKVLINWDGITDDGKPVPYSKETAKAWFENREMAPFHDAVVWASQVVDFGYDQVKGELEGNSQASSDGNSSTAKKPNG